MAIALPNLDDRRWTDLVDEARALIPVYAPAWTDHNASDPGITILELLSWLTESELYRLNRISDRQKRLMLALAGVRPLPPRPHRAMVMFTPTASNTVEVPAESTCWGLDTLGDRTTYRVLRDLSAIPVKLVTVLAESAGIFSRMPSPLPNGQSFSFTGESLYFGFDQPLNVGVKLALGLRFASDKALRSERERIPVGARHHHSVELVWESFGAGWSRMRVEDDTRSLTLNGIVGVTPLSPMLPTDIGGSGSLYFLRARVIDGQFDASPALLGAWPNVAETEQSTWSGSAPVEVARGTGDPDQTARLGGTVVESSVGMKVGGTAWERVDDFAASRPASAHFMLNATTGVVTFGNGKHGRAPELGAIVHARWLSTRARAGAMSPGLIHSSDIADLTVSNVSASESGSDEETLPSAIGRARDLREAPLRAVTLADIESIALRVPGTDVARAIALANRYPGVECVNALGVITLVIVPNASGQQPYPSAGLLRVVTGGLNAVRIISTRLVVTGPEYVEVTVRARVRSLPGVSRSALTTSIADTLNRFFHPLYGGPEKNGWPLGRDVYRSEVLQAIDETPGVDVVLSMELSQGDHPPTCANLCVPSTALVAAGPHGIEVLA